MGDEGAKAPLVGPQTLLDLPALDGGRQHVGDGLQEVDIVGGKDPMPRRVRPEDTEGARLTADDDAQPADHPVLEQQRRRGEARLRRQVVDDDRGVGAEGVAGRRRQVGADHRLPDIAVPPAETGPQEQRLAVGLQLEDFAEVDIEGGGDRPHRGVDQGVEIVLLQRPLPELGHHRLLAHPRLDLRLRRVALGDVDDQPEQADRQAGAIAHDAPGDGQPADGAVGPDEPELGPQVGSVVPGRCQALAHRFAIVRMDQGEDGLAGDTVGAGGATEELVELRRPGDDVIGDRPVPGAHAGHRRSRSGRQWLNRRQPRGRSAGG